MVQGSGSGSVVALSADPEFTVLGRPQADLNALD